MATKRQMLNKLQGSESVSSAITPTTSLPSGALPQMQSDSSADILAKSLGNFGNNLKRAQAANEKKRLEEQEKLVPMYAEMVKKQYNIESIEDIPSKVQLREDGFMPEDSMVVSTQIIQSLGKKFGKEFMLERIEGVRDEFGDFVEGKEGLSNEIRNNPEALNDWIRSTKEELFETVGDKPFMSAGALEGADAEAEIIVNIARQERANYHRALDTEHFVEKIEEVIATSSPEELVEEIKKLDSEQGLTGSLNNLERKKTIVATMITQATANRDTGLLDALQKAGFGGGATQADIDKARQLIPNLKIDDLVRKEKELELANAESIREATGIINQYIANGDYEGLKAYRDKAAGQSDPTSLHIFEYAQIAEDAAQTPESVSDGNRVLLEGDIRYAYTTGDFSKFKLDSNATEEDIIKIIQTTPNINETHRSELISKLPNLRQGYQIVRNDRSNNTYRNSFSSKISVLQQSDNNFFLQQAGINIQQEVRSVYDETIQNGVEDILTETGEPPKPDQLKAIYSEAVTNATAKLNELEGLIKIDRTGNVPSAQERVRAYQEGKDKPNSPYFEPTPDKVYFTFSEDGTKKIGMKWTGQGAGMDNVMDEGNWEQVSSEDVQTSNTSVETGSDSTETTDTQPEQPEASSVNKNTVTPDVLKERVASQRERSTAGYNAVSDIFDRDAKQFNLDDQTTQSIVDTIKSKSSRVTDRGLTVQTPLTSAQIRDVILETLGLQDNEDFAYGGLFDRADEDGEVGIEKLVKSIQEKL